MTLKNVKLLRFPVIKEERGNLSFFENNHQIPFTINTTSWIYDMRSGSFLEGYAYKNFQEVIIALAGSFDIVLHDGRAKRRFTLNRSYFGLYIPQMIWRSIENFTTNSLALYITDGCCDENEYIKKFGEFTSLTHE